MERPRLLTIVGLCLLAMGQAAKEADGVELSRGRQILLNRGLQLQSLAYPNSGFSDMELWRSANFTTLDVHVWSYPWALEQLPVGQQWSREYEPTIPYTKYVSAAELPYANNLVMYLYGDELTNAQLSNSATLSDMAATYAEWRLLYPSVLVGTNGMANIPSNAVLTNYMRVTQPDMIMFDNYPTFSFSNSARNTWYSAMQMYRTAGLAGNDGTGTTPIPYAQYLNLYRSSITNPLPSESFVRLQQNASWAFGYTIVDAFVYNYVTPDVAAVMFSTTDDSAPTAVFDYVKETNRQSRNLGPALVRLVSSGIYLKPGSGKSVSGTGLSAWSAHAGNTTGYTDYITAITPTVSQGGATDTSYSDILVGYLKPLLADNSDATFADGLHFMIVNGSASGTASASAQWYRITFDFADSGITALERLSRDTGLVERIQLMHLSGSLYALDLNLPGGTGDLFRLAPLVPGDFDSDGDVDGADFVAWQTAFPKASGATLAQGDADRDGDVDGADFVVWQTHFSDTPGAGSAPVPEPTGIALAIFSSVVSGLFFSRQSLIPRSRRFASATILQLVIPINQ